MQEEHITPNSHAIRFGQASLAAVHLSSTATAAAATHYSASHSPSNYSHLLLTWSSAPSHHQRLKCLSARALAITTSFPTTVKKLNNCYSCCLTHTHRQNTLQHQRSSAQCIATAMEHSAPHRCRLQAWSKHVQA